ncbi:MAG TPA: hypothetical protein VGC67_09060 [Cellulomonas sp.]
MTAAAGGLPLRRSLRPARRRAGRVLVPATALGLVAAWMIGASVAPTQAVLRDDAGLNTAVGSAARFDIALVQDGVLRQAGDAGVSWTVDGAGSLVPGRTVSFEVPVVNNGPYDATVQLAVEDRYAETATSGAGSDPIALYRWSVADAETGAVLAGDPADPLTSTVTAADLGDALGPFDLTARTLAAVGEGQAWPGDPASPGDHRVLRVTIAYPDTPESEPFNGGRSELALTFTAVSR